MRHQPHLQFRSVPVSVPAPAPKAHRVHDRLRVTGASPNAAYPGASTSAWHRRSEPARSGTARAQGLGNVRIIRPGIDVDRFEQVPPRAVREFVLLAGSAPWVEEQFQSKGFDALFRIASANPWLRLILLWRGHLRDTLDTRLGERGLVDRVEVIDEWTDVGRLLARTHAAIVLAARPELIKAYPH